MLIDLLRAGTLYQATCAEAGDRNLPSYLGLNEEGYNSLLIKLKLARKCGQQVEMLQGNWTSFISNEYNGVPEYYEITRFDYFKSRMLFIKLGGKRDVNVYNPGKQQPTNVKAWTYENLERKYVGGGNGRTGERETNFRQIIDFGKSLYRTLFFQ